MAAKKLLQRVSGKMKEYAGVVVSAGTGSAGDYPALDGNGLLDTSFMPVGIGADTNPSTAYEALAAGDLVSVFDDSGTQKVRKADASGTGKEANGFVQASAIVGAAVTVYSEGTNNFQTGLPIAGDLYLSATTPGKATGTVPSGTGKIVQRVGTAFSATSFNLEIGPSIELL